MVLTDTIADMLTTIRNGLLVQKEKVQTPFSKVKSNVLKVLTEEGYIKDYKIINETIEQMNKFMIDIDSI